MRLKLPGVRTDQYGMSSVHVADVRRDDFVAAPIPAAQVLGGDPRARSCGLHASRTGGVSMNLWDCTAGRFRWHFAGDELIQVLEGEVHVTDSVGTVHTLRAGDTAHFASGSSTTWEIPDYLKKLAVHRSPATLPDRLLSKAMRFASRA